MGNSKKAEDAIIRIKYKCYTDEYDQEVTVTKEVPISSIDPVIDEGTYGSFCNRLSVDINECPVCFKNHEIIIEL